MSTFFDPRTIATPVYEGLSALRNNPRGGEPSEQKKQAVELYTYLSTWGLMRLKAEERALSQEGKKQVVKKFFECLGSLSGYDSNNAAGRNIVGEGGLDILKELPADDYLGLTGLGLTVAQEFSFWATAVYQGIDESN